MDDLIPIHIGLMGHIDHGKTAIARVLSEKVSTAGLDAHDQAKKRGITIDLGFTMFRIENKLVTLVDSPGHADLIRSVVAGAGIIDAAIVVVAADEGPMVQTGEHLVVLHSMGIDHIIIVVSKIELVSEDVVASVARRMKALVDEIGFNQVDFIQVSAHAEKGIDELRILIGKVEPKLRRPDEPLFIPIDHAFKVKGHGTVVTGTILQGKIMTGQKIRIEPLGKSAKIRSIQTFGEQKETAKSGDRVGLNVPDINHDEIFRGCYVTEDDSLQVTSRLFVKLFLNPYYKGRVTKKMVLSATIGMPTVTAEIVPIADVNNQYISINETQSNEFESILLLKQRLAIRPNMKVLLMRTDLPPTVMRIIASGYVIKTMHDERIFRRKQRIGKIHRIRETDVLVDGLASSQEIAKQIVGKTILTESENQGVITGTFGTRGVVSATFNSPVALDEAVIYERFDEEVYDFGS